MLKATSASISGQPGSYGFSYSQEFVPDADKFVTHGHLFCLIASQAHRESVVPSVVAREILTSLQNEYYKSESKAFTSLKSSIEKVVSKFSLTWGELEIVAGAFVSGVLYSAVWGFGQVSILRKGMLASLLIGRGEMVTASGYPEDGDSLIFSTKGFSDLVPRQVLKDTLLAGDPLQTQTNLSSYSASSRVPFGALVIFFSNENLQTMVSPANNPQAVKKNILEPLKLLSSKFLGVFRRRLPARDIYIREPGFSDYEAGSKKTTLTVGIILIVLLVVSILFGIRQRNIKVAKSRYEVRLTQAIHEFEESESLFSINPERSRELFLSSRQIAGILKDEGVEDESLLQLLSKLSSKEGDILGEYKATLENFVDLSLVSDGFFGVDLASSGEEVFIVDNSLRRVVKVNLASKRSEVVAGPDDFSSGGQIVSYEDRSFIVNQDGVIELGDENKIDKSWEGDVLVYSYAANIYILEKSTSSIWRYSGSSSGFGSKQAWLGSGLTLDFTSAKSFAIDGSMWILDSFGDITKLTFGTIDSFGITGLPGDLLGATNIYTNENLESVYVLDPVGARIVVLDKDGVFKGQYVSEELKNAVDLVVSEEEGKTIILIDGNLKMIELTHL